jgi:anti-sigma-K factor RskA
MSELEHTDALAAEYVLGTLDAGERAQARALLTVDPGFVAKVQFWERRLGELHTMVEPVEPEPGLWLRIKARMTEPQAEPVSLPESQNLEPPPAAVAADVAPREAPSLEEIEATIAEATAALNADMAQAAPAEAPAASAAEAAAAEAPMAEAPAAEVPETEVPAADVLSFDAIEVTISETTVTLGADAAQASSPDAAAAVLDGTSAATSAEPAPASPAVAAPAPGWEAAPAPAAEAAPAWEAAPAAPAERMPAAPVLTVAEVADATATAETTAPVEAPAGQTPPEPMAVEPVVPPSELPSPAVAPVVTAEEKWTPAVEPQPALMVARRGLRRWRAFALLMTLVVVAVAALLAAWRFAPERVPPMLRPLELMRQMGVTVPATAPPPRRPLPPQTQFDE